MGLVDNKKSSIVVETIERFFIIFIFVFKELPLISIFSDEMEYKTGNSRLSFELRIYIINLYGDKAHCEKSTTNTCDPKLLTSITTRILICVSLEPPIDRSIYIPCDFHKFTIE